MRNCIIIDGVFVKDMTKTFWCVFFGSQCKIDHFVRGNIEYLKHSVQDF